MNRRITLRFVLLEYGEELLMSRYFLLAFLLLCFLGAGCKEVPKTSPRGVDPAELTRVLEASTVDWNKGNLDGFIAPYDSSSTFMTKSGPVGREELRERYRKGYFTGGHPDQTLRFEQINVRPLGEDHAVMTGRFILTGGGKPEQSGWFSLVWVRTGNGWKILHDHSS